MTFVRVQHFESVRWYEMCIEGKVCVFIGFNNNNVIIIILDYSICQALYLMPNIYH